MVAWVLHHAYGLDAGCGGAKEAVDLMSLLLLCQLGMGEFLGCHFPSHFLFLLLPLILLIPSFFFFSVSSSLLSCNLALF
jgi:hypothetical protein